MLEIDQLKKKKRYSLVWNLILIKENDSHFPKECYVIYSASPLVQRAGVLSLAANYFATIIIPSRAGAWTFSAQLHFSM